MKKYTIPATTLILISIIATLAFAWSAEEHRSLTRSALAMLPESVPLFFRHAAPAIAQASLQPDILKNRRLPHLTDAERPQHFLDFEAVDSADLPSLRSQYIKLCAAKNVNPSDVGYLPYAVTEWTQHLALAFSEYRRRPDDPATQWHCILTAGTLAHYAEDLAQPLHTTVHYDGRADAENRSPHSGIHDRVDRLLRKLQVDPAITTPSASIQPFPDLFPAVFSEFKRSHQLVDRVYQLAPRIPSPNASTIDDPEVFDFAMERYDAAARFTARLFLTAWQQSADIELESWTGYATENPQQPPSE